MTDEVGEMCAGSRGSHGAAAAWGVFYGNGKLHSSWDSHAKAVGMAFTMRKFDHTGVYVAPREWGDMRNEVVLPKGYEMTITPQPWIPVTERLPEDGDTVWAYEGGDYVFLADFSSGRFLSVGHQLDREGLNYEQYKGITHWMEVAMPPPPTDSK